MSGVRSLCTRLCCGLGFILWLAFGSSWAVAQNFDFRPPASVVDPTTPAVMRDLAERILPVYQEENPERYLSNLSALQLVAGNYTAAYESRQSLRDRRRNTEAGRPVGRSLILDVYAHARAIEASDRMPFAQAFTKAYGDAIPKLNDLDAFTVMGWLGTAPASFQDPVQRAFDQHRAKGNIALPDAVDLMQAYVVFDAYRNFGPIVGALDTEDEERRYSTEEDILIKTRDPRVTLAAILVRPKNATSPLPALLEYTPYLTPGYAREIAAHGYVAVIAYVRGRGKSSGTPTPYQNDGEDVRAAIDWIAKQTWSDGRVGMYGTAYSGFTGWAAAKKLPPALKAIAATSPTAPGIDFPDDGAVFRNSAYRWSLYVTNAIDEKTYNDEATWQALDFKWYTSGKPYRDLASLYGKPDPFLQHWVNHPSYDGYWRALIPFGREFAKVNIPVLTVTGYYAAGEGGALYYFNEHRRNDPHANHTLLIGPYDDGVSQRGVQPVLRRYQVDQAALVDLRELRYQWFDSVLKGAPVPALLQGRVNYEVMGANEWRHADSLEAMGNGTLKYYLDAQAVGASHRLAQRGKPSDAKFVNEVVNLEDRKDFDANWVPPTDIVSQSVEVRNASTYVSEPLKKPLELQGAWSARLDLTVNKMDVDLKIAAYELLPSGEYVRLFEPYVFRASYAHDRAHRHLLKAGEREVLAFKIERLTSRKLETGSRIVLVLGVNKRPDQEINYGSGGEVSAESLDGEEQPPGSQELDPELFVTNRAAVKIRWYSDSYIEMPVRR